MKSIERRYASEKNIVRTLQKEFSSLKVSLQNKLNLIDFAHVSALFLKIDDRKDKKVQFSKKSYIHLYQKVKTENDPEKVLFNFVLSHNGKKLLAKGLNFSLSLKQLKYADYLVDFELSFLFVCFV